MGIDQEKLDRFVESAMLDIKGGMVMLMANLGDRLGLFRALAEAPATSAELAERTALQERYVREWASCMACSGYIEHDATSDRFAISPEQAEVLVNEKSPVYFAGLWQEMAPLWALLPNLAERFRHGGGLSLDEYHEDWWKGMERFTATWFENFLLQEWIPKADGVQHWLERGAHIADVGCGRGMALIKIAQAFPNVTAVGYDISEANLEAAREKARAAGVADRLRFEKRDIHEPLPERFDLITTFDVAHDLKDPDQAFRSIYEGLVDDGAYLLLDFKVGDTLDENIGPIGAMFYAWSVCYCMTTSLNQGGKALGTCGLPESVVREKVSNAGFESIEVVPFDNPFNVVYLAKKSLSQVA